MKDLTHIFDEPDFDKAHKAFQSEDRSHLTKSALHAFGHGQHPGQIGATDQYEQKMDAQQSAQDNITTSMPNPQVPEQNPEPEIQTPKSLF